ncbi:MAG: ABC transporter permease [Candidatus Scatomorpha sp.]|jgi:spermidine/putrescine transport system permease protein
MKKVSKIFMILVLIFLYLPIVILIVASFNTSADIARLSGFTFSQYTALFQDSALLPLLGNSLIVAALSSLIATVMGTMAALGIYSMRGKLRSLALTVTNIPLTNPDIVTGVSLALVFVFVGRALRINNVLGFTTLLIAHISFNLSYVILAVLPKLTQMDKNLRDAALDLGCTPLQAFFKVIFFEILPGIISGALLSFAMSLDDFVISYFVYGPSFVTLPVEIYNYTKKPLHPKIYALFTVLFAAILIIMVLMNILEALDAKRTRNIRKTGNSERGVKFEKIL